MTNQLKEVSFESLDVGDTIHVSFKSSAQEKLYLDEVITEIDPDTGWETIFTEANRGFHKSNSRYYLVTPAPKKLPQELGAVVQHADGWRFVRFGEDAWRAIDDTNRVRPIGFTNGEVEQEEWEVVA